MNFIDRAIKAHQAQVEAQEQYQQAEMLKRTQHTGRYFTERFEVEPDTVYGNIVTIDGLTLVAWYNEYDRNPGWKVQLDCPKCGEKVLSSACYNLEQIGTRLTENNPAPSHFCPQPAIVTEPDDSPEARLIQAVKDVVAGMLPSLEY